MFIVKCENKNTKAKNQVKVLLQDNRHVFSFIFEITVLSHKGFCLWFCYSTEQTCRRQAARKSDGPFLKQTLEVHPEIWLVITYLTEDQKKCRVSQKGILIVWAVEEKQIINTYIACFILKTLYKTDYSV